MSLPRLLLKVTTLCLRICGWNISSTNATIHARNDLIASSSNISLGVVDLGYAVYEGVANSSTGLSTFKGWAYILRSQHCSRHASKLLIIVSGSLLPLPDPSVGSRPRSRLWTAVPSNRRLLTARYARRASMLCREMISFLATRIVFSSMSTPQQRPSISPF